MTFQIWRECLAHSIERSAHRFQGFRIVDIPDVAEWGHFVLPLVAPMQATRLCYCGRDEKRASFPCTVHAVCENCKSDEPITEPSSRNRAVKNEFAADAFAGSRVPRSRFSSALSHSRRTTWNQPSNAVRAQRQSDRWQGLRSRQAC